MRLPPIQGPFYRATAFFHKTTDSFSSAVENATSRASLPPITWSATSFFTCGHVVGSFLQRPNAGEPVAPDVGRLADTKGTVGGLLVAGVCRSKDRREARWCVASRTF